MRRFERDESSFRVGCRIGEIFAEVERDSLGEEICRVAWFGRGDGSGVRKRRSENGDQGSHVKRKGRENRIR